MDQRHQDGIILDNYHKLINEAITREGITSWQETEFKIDGKDGLAWHGKVCSGAPPRVDDSGNPIKIDSIKNSEELSMLASELQFIVGQLYVYRIHIRDSSERPAYGAESLFYPKKVNYAEGTFNMLVNLAYQTCYNYWDRIADLINPFLPYPIKETSIDLTRVINAVPLPLQSANFVWLKNYCENEYKEMNNARRIIVHYEVPSTGEIFEHMKNISDKDVIKKMYLAKQEKADYFKQKCAEMIEGLIYCLLFLEDANAIHQASLNPGSASH